MSTATPINTPPPPRLDLTDPERRRLTIEARDQRGRLRSISVAPPCMAQLLAVIRLEPADSAGESHMQRVQRDFRSALIMSLPPFPTAWWERLPWYLLQWRTERFLKTLSYSRLAQLINHLIALAQGVPVDMLEQMAQGAAALPPTEREKQLNELIAMIAAEMKMPPKEVAELPARDLAMLAEQVNVKLQRDNQWRELIAGLRR